jgi:protein involved in ribonucleotide reduction
MAPVADFLTAVKNAQKCIKIIANEELNWQKEIPTFEQPAPATLV